MNIDAQDFAIRSIHASLHKQSNVNWMRDIVIDEEFAPVGEDSTWFYKSSHLYIDLALVVGESSKLYSFIGDRHSEWVSVDMGPIRDKRILRSEDIVIVDDDASLMDEEYWDSIRPYPITEKEEGIYYMAESIKNHPVYKVGYAFLVAGVDGFLDIGKIGFGPLMQIYSSNNLEGKRVYHINFGEGVIKSQIIRDDQDTDIIVVKYLNGEMKKYRYPVIFTDFLKMIDDKDDAIIQRDISEFKNKELAKKSEPKPVQNASISLSAAEYSNKRQNTKRIDIDKGHRYPTKNVAFKCTYNDGGKDKNGIGFSYICSDEQIRRNIKEGRSWCSNESCACKEYYDGVISRHELDSVNDNGGWVCYESVMLIDWKAQAGERNSNVSQKPVTIKIRNAYKDSLAILTTRIPGSPEQERIIFGLFIIADYYEGDEDTAGYVSAHSKYRLVFSAEEGRRLKLEVPCKRKESI